MLGLSLMNFCQMNKVLTHIEPKRVVFQGLWRDLGYVLGHLGIRLAYLGSILGVLWLCWLKVGASLGFWRGSWLCLGIILAPFYLHVGRLLAMLAPSWGILGFLERFGALSWGIWASYWPILAPCWVSSGYVGSKLGHLEAILAPTERLWEPSWGS